MSTAVGANTSRPSGGLDSGRVGEETFESVEGWEDWTASRTEKWSTLIDPVLSTTYKGVEWPVTVWSSGPRVSAVRIVLIRFSKTSVSLFTDPVRPSSSHSPVVYCRCSSPPPPLDRYVVPARPSACLYPVDTPTARLNGRHTRSMVSLQHQDPYTQSPNK